MLIESGGWTQASSEKNNCRSGVLTAIAVYADIPWIVGATDGRELLETGTILRPNSRPSVAPTLSDHHAHTAYGMESQAKKRPGLRGVFNYSM